MSEQQGFSLPETLVALLLFTLSFTALMHYQLALAKGAQQQLQQREAWRQAWLRFEGYQAVDWQSSLMQRPGPEGCLLLAVTVISPLGRKAELKQLHCDP
ncbi:prepilin-type N-terminal cleavage/methylation domain-containing protein [Pantoea sp. BAV 3049]|uniref:prepilin-type N-terminal cleavage/methylation domain-containing protein n=1 Tax=Pantoea sp. BAV 3049 TaxID=2654188 RepID=UPI00131AB575|nr:prepilin-type N-terminal cleavage/methylation domain-containing protein [Pantoea sp. BAV 3049]